MRSFPLGLVVVLVLAIFIVGILGNPSDDKGIPWNGGLEEAGPTEVHPVHPEVSSDGLRQEVPANQGPLVEDSGSREVVVKSVLRGSDGFRPATGSVVWALDWIEPHAAIAEYRLDPTKATTVDNDGVARIRLDEEVDRILVVVDFLGERKRLTVEEDRLRDTEPISVLFDPPAAVRGIVRLDGTPLADAEIRLAVASEGPTLAVPMQAAQSDSGGCFEMFSAPPGEWRFVVYADEIGNWASESFTLHPEVSEFVELDIDGLGRRKVQLLTVDGKPIPGLDVSLTTPAWEIYGPIRTDSDGIASFMLDPEESVQVSVFAAQRDRRSFPPVESWIGSEQPTLVLREVQPEQVVRGVVKVNGQAVTYGTVRAMQFGTQPIRTEVSPENGSFEIQGLLPESSIQLEFSQPGCTFARRIEVTPKSLEQFVELTFPGGSVNVKVRDAMTKRPVPGCPFVLISPLGERLPSTMGTSTDPLGESVVRGLAPGVYQAVVGPGVLNDSQEGSYTTVIQPFTVSDHALEAALDIDLDHGEVLELKVQDETGRALKGVSVFTALQGVQLTHHDLTGTNSSGRKKIYGLPQGPIEVCLALPGHSTFVGVLPVGLPGSPAVHTITLARGRLVNIAAPSGGWGQVPQVFQRRDDGQWSSLDLSSTRTGVARRPILGFQDQVIEGSFSPGSYRISWGEKGELGSQSTWDFQVPDGTEPLFIQCQAGED